MTSSEPPTYPGDNGPSSDLPAWGSYEPPPGGSAPPPIGGSGPFSPTDAIGWGWRKFLENIGPILLAALALICASIALSILGRIISGGDSFLTYDSQGFGFSAAGLVTQIISTFVGYVISAALIRGALDVADGKPFHLGDTFGRLPLANVVMTSLLTSLLVMIGLVLCVIPGLVVATLTAFAMYFVVDKDQGPMEAITSSSRLVRDNLGDTIVLFLLSVLVVILGVICCLIGVFAAIPVAMLAWAYAYRTLLGEPVAP